MNNDIQYNTSINHPTSIDTESVSSFEDQLSPAELNLLSTLESDIFNNLAAFLVVGQRLMKIRDSRLYRDQYKSFELYCRDRWHLSSSHAKRLIQAHACANHLRTANDPSLSIPNSESHLRVLAVLEPDQQVAAARAIHERYGKEPLTARKIKAVTNDLFPKAQPEPKPKKHCGKVVQVEFQPRTRGPKMVLLSTLISYSQELKTIFRDRAQTDSSMDLIETMEAHLHLWNQWYKQNVVKVKVTETKQPTS